MGQQAWPSWDRSSSLRWFGRLTWLSLGVTVWALAQACGRFGVGVGAHGVAGVEEQGMTELIWMWSALLALLLSDADRRYSLGRVRGPRPQAEPAPGPPCISGTASVWWWTIRHAPASRR